MPAIRNNRPTVLVGSSIFPNNREVTKGIYIFHQAIALAKYCNVKVVAPVPYFPGYIKSTKYGLYSQIKKEETINGLHVLHPRVLVIPKFCRSCYGFLYLLCLFPLMKRLKQLLEPDIMLCYWAFPDGFANVIMSKLLRLPVILGGRGCDVNNADDYRTKRVMVSWALNASDRVLAVSEAMKRKMIELNVPEDKIRVISNGLDDMFKPLDKGESQRKAGIYGAYENKKMILYCGRLSSEKGLEYLIKAAKILNDKNVPFYLLLVGEGPQKHQLKALVKSFALKNRVQFKDEMPYEKMPVVMSSSDIFCLPSIREGWPNVVMEALACGLPVVASNVGGVPEILTSPDYGIAVPKQDPERLANALMTAMQKSWDRDKLRAAVRSRTWDSVAKEIYAEINLVLAR